MKRRRTNDLDEFRAQLLRDANAAHVSHKLIHAIELITKDQYCVFQKGKLAQFGLETSNEEKDDLDNVFQDMWKQDIRYMQAQQTDHKQDDVADLVTYAVSWSEQELAELRRYVTQLRTMEKQLMLNKKIAHAAYEYEQDVLSVAKVREMEQNFALTVRKNKKFLSAHDQHILRLEHEKEIWPIFMKQNQLPPLERTWPSNAKIFPGYFHICEIAKKDVELTWARVIAVCSRLTAEVALHMDVYSDDTDHEMYVDLNIEDFFQVGVAVSRHLNYAHYVQYYFLKEPQRVVAHASQHYERAWPVQNGNRPKGGYFILEDVQLETRTWNSLICFVAPYKKIKMHVQKQLERQDLFIFCLRKDFVNLSKEIATMLSYVSNMTYYAS